MSNNIDPKTVESFGDEWSRFNQVSISDEEARKRFDEYFSVFPWSVISSESVGFDMGCGSGRWARFIAPKVGKLHCVDPSEAIKIARTNLSRHRNIIFHHKSIDTHSIPPCSQDFGYSLGVLHHVPDTAVAIRACANLLKPGAPLLLYLYYDFENRPWWFRGLWRISDFIRRIIYRLPPSLKHIVTDIIAVLVYLPFTTFSRLMERIGFTVDHVPLSYYRKCSFYTMRTDARDRFGTPLEHRFSKKEISEMMDRAGLVNVRFSDEAPYWCVVGIKDK